MIHRRKEGDDRKERNDIIMSWTHSREWMKIRCERSEDKEKDVGDRLKRDWRPDWQSDMKSRHSPSTSAASAAGTSESGVVFSFLRFRQELKSFWGRTTGFSRESVTECNQNSLNTFSNSGILQEIELRRTRGEEAGHSKRCEINEKKKEESWGQEKLKRDHKFCLKLHFVV